MNIITAGTRKITIPNFGPVVPARPRGGAAFTGAYDSTPNIAAAYGMRRLLSSYTGNLLRVRRALDDDESDFGYDSNGDLLVAAIATFLSGGSGFVKTWYDQSGNGVDATQATAANQPLYVASGQNSRPVQRFDGSDWLQTAAFSTAIEQPDTHLVVAKLDAAVAADGTQYVLSAGNVGNPTQLIYKRSTNNWVINAGTTREDGAADGNWHVWSVLFSGASSQLWHDGTSKVTGEAGALSLTGLTIGALQEGSTPWDGDLAEYVLADPAWDTTERQAAEAAANDYWQVF